MEENYDSICGVSGCHEPTIVHIRNNNVTRCAKHYCQDYDRHKTGHVQTRINPEQFQAEDDILDSLADCDMLQKHGEPKKEYTLRCKNWSLKMMGRQFSSLVNPLSGKP